MLSALDPAVLRLAVSLGIGLLIGVERERRKGEGPSRAPAGIRTFTLAALLGGVSLLLPSPAHFSCRGSSSRASRSCPMHVRAPRIPD
ncbi:MAG: MgtC/SapB family protein [Candidatus Eiseniibacteriota bacterium]